MSHKVGLKVVAEGGKEDQKKYLERNQCDICRIPDKQTAE